MPLSPDSRLGRYQILSTLGVGGMGEVYRARDTKLGRDVAVKVLPAAFSTDTERLRRFEQEAQAAGALNHPNILSVHDVGTHDGAPYVVTELLEGETLREHLSDATLSTRKAINYATQIAQALSAAHEKGIVHRDLKPENIFITTDGRVKILDFGLAKLIERTNNGEVQTEAPTRRVQTDPGTVMGTVGYMSPEQVRGKPADHRSDIFSFGAVLYEMLSGKRAFKGDSAVETMSAILREDPPEISETNRSVAPALERIVHHCLEKNSANRFQSARDLAFALESLSTPSGATATSLGGVSETEERTVTRNKRTLREWLPWALAGLLLVAVVALAIYSFRRAEAPASTLRFQIAPPEKRSFNGSIAISPDARSLAFVATNSEGVNSLWVRNFDAIAAQELPATEGAQYPFWSPDSRFVGFFAKGKLEKIEVAGGGRPVPLCDAPEPRGGAWGADGWIIFTPRGSSGLYRVQASASDNAQPEQVTQLDEARKERSHRWPVLLPDGRHFLYASDGGTPEATGIWMGMFGSKETKRLISDYSPAAYSPQGYLLFLRDLTLMAQGFDANKLQLTGEPQVVADKVWRDGQVGGLSGFAVSANGLLVFRTGGVSLSQLVWFDRAGKQLGIIGQPAGYLEPVLSPDEKRVAIGINPEASDQSMDVWIMDVVRGVQTRLTFNDYDDATPLWSPDGSRVVFTSMREGNYNLYEKNASGAGEDELLLKTEHNKYPNDWSPDGQFIIYDDVDPKTGVDLWVLPVAGDRKPIPYLQTPFAEHGAQFSPDGHFVAYCSTESGRDEVYVQTFPAGGGKWVISMGGGSQPRWRRDGKELFYITPDKKLMVVDVKISGSTFDAGTPHLLFQTRINRLSDVRNDYTAAGDGQKFLINTLLDETSAPLTVVLNWTASLKQKQ